MKTSKVLKKIERELLRERGMCLDAMEKSSNKDYMQGQAYGTFHAIRIVEAFIEAVEVLEK